MSNKQQFAQIYTYIRSELENSLVEDNVVNPYRMNLAI